MDTQIWPTTTIPICWENYADIIANSSWDKRRKNTITYLNDSWGKATKLKFVEYARKQCPRVSTGYNGARVLVDSNRGIYIPAKNITLFPPYVTALGSKLKDRPNGIVLDFDIGLSVPYLGCILKGVLSPEVCFKASVIHEFGHVIGISHEQNRNDAIPGINSCNFAKLRDPLVLPRQFGTTAIGNIKIGKYDQMSIMNYCNRDHPGTTALSSIDVLAARIYYGNMPSWNTPLGFNNHVGKGIRTIRIPSLKIGATYYNATLSASTDANRDGIYDNVFTLVKTPIPGNVNISSYPVTVVNGVINIAMAKRTVSSPLYPYPFGKVAYLGHWGFKAIPGTTDKWAATSNYGNYNALYPITQQ
ncbi:hypothetical protein [Methyloglobulus sp.]|uniref:hypothetical protein n=1 Tax=Methyloglobulus sp. TaxID=2518622 RepID=UPI0032B77E12